MAKTSIVDVLALLGEPGLEDSDPGVRDRFRAFLRSPKWSPDDLGGWIDECLEVASRAQPVFYFALQDLVVSIGSHLGFEVEYGSYTGSGAAIPYDGRWRTVTGEDILVEVKSSPWPLGMSNQLGQYMDEYGLTTGRGPRHVFGIYAIGYGDFTGLIDQIKGGEYRNRIKVVSFKDLLRLFSLGNLLTTQMPRQRVYQVMQDLMLPFESIDVGGILEIIQNVATASLAEEGLGVDDGSCAIGEWRRSELHRFLEECQPNQIALVLCLCTATTMELSTDDLTRRMKIVAPFIPGLDGQHTFTARTIGGARSGLSKREQQIGKNSILESRNGRYFIREGYREWVREWLEDRDLLPLKIELEPELDGLFAQAGRTQT